MNATATLTGSHLRTYNTIFQHPVSHNLEWSQVHALFRHIATVEETSNGNLKISRNGEDLILHPARTKDVAETEELMVLRHFLQRSEITPPATGETEAHWLVVIDHHEARLFRSAMQGTPPQHLLAHESEKFFRQEQGSENLSRGKEKPDPNTFFEPVAKELQTAGQILIFGTGKGKSGEMEQFINWLKVHHANLAARIIGSLVIDVSHLTDGQLLQNAREFYANLAQAHP
jgi:hypothetical protein